MAVNLRVLVPDGTTNYITNPSLRYDTTGYSAVGSAISRTLDQARFNIASLKVDTNGVAAQEGVYFRINGLSGVSEPVTASVYLRGSGIVRLRLIDNPGGKQWYSQPIYLEDRWVRFSVSGYATGSDDVRVYVETDVKAQDIVFYVDGVQLERKSYPTTFCDGDQDGCRWNGLYHSSTSTRTPYTRRGGRWIDLAGPCRENDNIYVTVMAGAGVPSQTIQQQSWALAPGSFLQGRNIDDRKVTLTFFLKNPKKPRKDSVGLGALHSMRQQLIDILKPDRTLDSDEIIFEYQNGDRPLYFRARYDRGLEGDWDIRNAFVSSLTVTLISADPIWVGDEYEVSQLAIQSIFRSAGKVMKILARLNGRWTVISEDGTGYWTAGLGSSYMLRDIAFGPKGEVYFCGPYVYKWDGSSMTVIGTPNVGTYIHRMAISPSGTLYACGTFTSMNGVAANYVAQWDGSSWSALGAGSNNNTTCAIVAPNGQLYIGSATSVAVSGRTFRFIARWDGGEWRAVGTGGNPGLSHDVQEFRVGIDRKTLYACGAFTSEYPVGTGTDLNRVAAIDLDTNTFSALGNGLGPDGKTVEGMDGDVDGSLCTVGTFQVSGTKTVLKIGFWSGSDWYQLGDLVPDDFLTVETSRASRIAIDPVTRDIYLLGRFADFYGVRRHQLLKWNGDRRTKGGFSTNDIYFSNGDSANYNRMKISPNGDIFIVGWESGDVSGFFSSIFAPGTTVINNRGTAEARPKFFIRGPCVVRHIKNLTTGNEIPLALVVNANEEIAIDCETSSVRSSIRGDLSYALLPVGSLSDFWLVPGQNEVAVLITEDVGAIAQISFTPKYQGADATEIVEALA